MAPITGVDYLLANTTAGRGAMSSFPTAARDLVAKAELTLGDRQRKQPNGPLSFSIVENN